ncbi:MAG: hypothetical protein WC829_01350 [Hyphomicrobium sp.]|jgi:hypothetical protein
MAYAEQSTNPYANQGAKSSATPKAETLQSLIENFDPLLTHLEQLVHRSSVCADRVCGPLPQEAGGTSSISPEPNHLIWAARARQDRLNILLSRLSEQVVRIENGLA